MYYVRAALWIFFLSLLVSLHLFSVGGLTCYDGRQDGVTSQREAWVLEGQWVWGFSRASKILFGDMECSSFRWLCLENSAKMKNCSNVLRCVPLSRYCRICIVWCMGPNMWDCSKMCLA